MSVITYHEVSNEKKDLFDRLTAEGVIHPGQIYSSRRHEYVKFDSVFDYTKCDKETLAELDKRTAEHKKLFREELAQDPGLTEKERAYRYAENIKCDTHLMPVSRSNNGGIAWFLNYYSDDLPSVAIGRRYPDEVLEYVQATEGELTCHVKYQKDTDLVDLISNKPIFQSKDSDKDMSVELDMSDVGKKSKDRENGKNTGKGSR